MSKYNDLVKDRVEKELEDLDNEITKLVELGENSKVPLMIAETLKELVAKKDRYNRLVEELQDARGSAKRKLTRELKGSKILKWFYGSGLENEIKELSDKLNKLTSRRSFSSVKKVLYKYFSGTGIKNKLMTFSKLSEYEKVLVDFGKNKPKGSEGPHGNESNFNNPVPKWVKSNYPNYWVTRKGKVFDKKDGSPIKNKNTGKEVDLSSSSGSSGSSQSSSSSSSKRSDNKRYDNIRSSDIILKSSILGNRTVTFDRILNDLVDVVNRPADTIEGEVARALFELCYNHDIYKFTVSDIRDPKKKLVVPATLRKAYDFLNTKLVREILGDKLANKVKGLKSSYGKYEDDLKSVCNEFTDRINMLTLLRRNNYGMNGHRADYMTFNPILDRASEYNKSKYTYLDDYLGGDDSYNGGKEFTDSRIDTNRSSSPRVDRVDQNGPNKSSNSPGPSTSSHDSDEGSEDDEGSESSSPSIFSKLKSLKLGNKIKSVYNRLSDSSKKFIEAVVDYYDPDQIDNRGTIINSLVWSLSNSKDPIDELIKRMDNLNNKFDKDKFMKEFNDSGIYDIIMSTYDDDIKRKIDNKLEILDRKFKNFSRIKSAYRKIMSI